MSVVAMDSAAEPTIRPRQFSLCGLMGLLGVTGCYLGLAGLITAPYAESIETGAAKPAKF